ncbi:WD repeat-containing protein 43 [Dinochytrium kinnereticum]|nr:WD repeat-containing protein 43 [Dinochytrium kinnereticum]
MGKKKTQKKDGPAKQPTSLSSSSVAALRQNTAAYSWFIHSRFDTPRADYFAAVTQVLDTHKISVFDCRTSALVVSLSPPSKETKFTCVAWGRDWSGSTEEEGAEVDGGEKEKKKKRRRSGAVAASSTHSGSRIIVAGTASGEILVYSLAHGTLQMTLQTGMLSSVNDFAFAPSGGDSAPVGYSVSGSGDVLKWNMATGTIAGRFKGDEHSLSKIAVDEITGRLVVAGYQVRLYDPSLAFAAKSAAGGSGSVSRAGLLKEFSGHASRVIGLEFARGGTLCLSAALEDRFVSVWDCDKGDLVGNVSALTAENPAQMISASSADHILALSETGRVELWASVMAPTSTSTSGSSKKPRGGSIPTLPSESSIAISVLEGGDSDKPAKGASILAAVFSEDKVVIAYGSNVKPTFERVSYLDANGNLTKSVSLTRGEVAHGLLVDNASLAAKTLGATARSYKELERSTVLGDTDSIPMQASGMGLEEDDSKTLVEPTLEERLNLLNIQSTSQNPAREGTGVRALRKPTATSLHSMLSQAVHSADRQLLETTLTVNDSRIILSTVRRLQPSLVVPLLDMLVGRLQAKPNRAAALIEWVRAIIVAHAAFLMTDPALVRHLGALYQTLDSRVGTFQKLVKLSGRLDLVMSQIALRSSQVEGGSAEDEEEEQAEAVYDEEDEDAEDGDELDEEEEEGEGDEAGVAPWDEEEEEEDVRSESEEEEEDDDDEEEEEDEGEGEEDEDEEDEDAEMMDEE